jgi:hypothetical protein
VASAARTGPDRRPARRPGLDGPRGLVRCRINRLARIDRVTGEPIRRYEHPHPGSLLHVDVTKFGNIPEGGGWRYVGRQQGDRNKAATALRTGFTEKRHPHIGTAFLHRDR